MKFAALLLVCLPPAVRALPPIIDIVCRSESPPLVPTPLGGICERGDKLYFGIERATRWRYLSAVAEMRSGEAIWYFPDDNGTASAEIPQGDALRWLTPVIIAADHPVGEARLRMVLSLVPQSLADVRETLRAGTGAVVEARLVIVPDA